VRSLLLCFQGLNCVDEVENCVSNVSNSRFTLSHQLVTQLGLPCRDTTPLQVMVGNGQYLECTSICDAIAIHIQNNIFIVALHVLPISGANIVLGVQWLKSLGPVLTDYTTLTMQFFYKGTLVTLQGDPEAHLSSLTSS